MAALKDLLVRRFTKALEDAPDKTVYDLFEWKTLDIFIKDYKRDKILCDMKDVEFPVHYTQNACDIIASHYFRKAGIPNKVGYERSMREVAHRLVGFWTSALKEEGLVTSTEENQILYDELVYLLLSQAWAPNSPQWFNTGLHWAYGLDMPSDGLYYYDLERGQVVESNDRYTRTQASACFILSIRDQLLGDQSITEQFVTETKLFKGGSGTGTNFSPLRGEGERLSGGGQSSGLLSFLKALDRNAGAIKSGGTTRRAAKMVIVDEDHPDVMEFVTWKAKEEDKVRALGKMGYDTDFNSEAYDTVSGQNSNNSLRLTDQTMEKILKLAEEPEAVLKLRGRADPSADKELSVKALWDAVNQSAYSCADPGLQFHDRFNDWHTCPAGEDGVIGVEYNQIKGTNPCSEYAFLNDTACNLASINLFFFYDVQTGEFRMEEYLHTIGLVQLVLEASIHWGQFPTREIARRSHLFRTTGLGPANLASLLMASGVPYDSEEARTLAAALQGIMTGYSYYVSALMAQQVGPFEKFSVNRDPMLRVIRNHSRVAGARQDAYESLWYKPYEVSGERLAQLGCSHFGEVLRSVWQRAERYGERYGFRNAQVTVVAPTGTISFAMDCGATSAEPFYAHVVYKKLAGGGAMVIVNPVMEVALRRLGYSEAAVEDIKQYILRTDDHGRIIDGKIEDAPHLQEAHLPVFDTAGLCGSGIRSISPEGHVLMVAALTPMISGSVSKTVNLPSSAAVEDIEHIHLLAYKTGVKAIALYRDGSKASQPLTSQTGAKRGRRLEEMTYPELLKAARSIKEGVPVRVRASGRRCGCTHDAKIGDIELYVTVNFYPDGKIAEVFISTDKEGTVVKGLLASLSKAVSNMLQYNIPAKEISRMLRGQQFEPSGFVSRHPYIKQASSISDLVSKIIDIELGDYSRCQVKPDAAEIRTPAFQELAAGLEPQGNLAEGERLYGESCSNCGSERLRRNGTCKVCEACGATTGCS